ncbi:unnamed protein product [Gongylonema pulchrum]|uniref:Expressed conserved protein n=1 Tax=Gongylonema pulchrum TaxID=637853 RepID=A0A183DH81_9BILA|nr:unnamed protein product [Gongylonema pulchrum]
MKAVLFLLLLVFTSLARSAELEVKGDQLLLRSRGSVRVRRVRDVHDRHLVEHHHVAPRRLTRRDAAAPTKKHKNIWKNKKYKTA